MSESADTPGTLFDQFLRDAAAERERVAKGANLISRDETVEELTPIGRLRWYLHARLPRPSTTSLYFHELELPPQSRNGKVRCQGGIVHLALSGYGYVVVDGVRHEWEPRDVIGIPPKEYGVTFQIFNESDESARLLVAWPNLDSALGPEAGVRYEVIEEASEYAAGGESGR